LPKQRMNEVMKVGPKGCEKLDLSCSLFFYQQTTEAGKHELRNMRDR
jgi:hypothetical protein